MEAIAVLALVGILAFTFAKRDSKKLDNAESPAQAVVYGGGSCGFMILATVAGIGALLLIGMAVLPNG